MGILEEAERIVENVMRENTSKQAQLYVEALERGDIETIDRILDESAQDEQLEISITQIHRDFVRREYGDEPLWTKEQHQRLLQRMRQLLDGE